MKITIERHLDDAITEAFVPIYHESFAHLAELSASKQVLSDTDFRRLMRSNDVLKFSGWNEGGELCAVALATPKLDLVPWVSTPFFAKRFPDQYGRDAIFYFLTILVRAENRDQSWAAAIMEAISLHCGACRGVTVFDCCTFNTDVVQVPEMIMGIARRCLEFDSFELDVQRYYALEIHGIREIDLRNLRHRDVVDLSDPASTAAAVPAGDIGARP